MLRRFVAVVVPTTLGLFVAGCGGDSAGPASIPAPPAAPAPPPTPTPPPAPTVATVSIPTPTVVAQISPAGGRTTTDAMASGSHAFFQVSDPDAPNATSIEEINFDGDESVALSVSAGGIPYEVDLQAPTARFATGNGNSYTDSHNVTRYVPVSVWQTANNISAQQIVGWRQLDEGRGGPSTAQTGDTTEHVKLIDTMPSGNIRAFQIAGSVSPASAIPVSGTATYAGQAFGSIFTGGNSNDFLGDAVVNIAFGQSFRPVSGRIDVAQFQNTFKAVPFVVTFQGDISGAAFVSQHLEVTGLSDLMAGTLAGNFYGPAADEIGAVFTASGASGNIIGGFVAGKQ